MKRLPGILAISFVLLIVLSLAACGAQPATVVLVPDAAQPVLGTPLMAGDQQILAATQTQVQIDANNQAAATAQILRDNAQATLDSANATLGAVQTQNQSNANAEAAQIAATVQMERAAARATLDSAAATQSAALTQDAIRQTQAADLATSDAGTMLNQQYLAGLAAATQTAVANQIATQTQAAVATTQGYADQAAKANADRQGPITFLFFICLPVFFVLLGGLILWGVWRWFKIQQDNQRNFGRAPEILPPPPPPPQIIDHRSDARLLSQERKIIDIPNPPARPVDQADGWLDEVKDRLESDEKKAEDDQSAD